ncbi:MAG: acetolactate synthase large subunit [Clostridia bacterium]|nr:acetolactate synthase large subunit [Clostridia bacterium]
MNVAEMLVESLLAEGVEYVFGIPGEENLELIEALAASPIRFITTRHEQGAAFMADVYGRLTGRAGVCLSTLGPGATNLITGVADANSDGAPLVAITGQVSSERMHITGHQYLDLAKLFEPITKRTKLVMRPDSITEIVRLAFKYAQQEGKMGATHIDLPVDVAKMEVPQGIRPMLPQHRKPEYADLETIAQAAKILARAASPVMLVGADAARAGITREIMALAHGAKIPVVNTMMAKGVIPSDDPYALGTIGIPQRDYQDLLLDRADVLLCVGYDIVELSPARLDTRLDKQIIHVSTGAAHVNRCYPPAIEVVGDMAETLRHLSQLTVRIQEPEYAFALRQAMLQEYAACSADEGYPVKPQRILGDVRKVMGAGDILLSDVGAHKMWIARHYLCDEPNTCLISNGFATMGIAVPGALAAKLLHPDKRVLAVTGDGGFMMNCQELETAVREQLPFVTLIFNDSAYGLIQWKQNDRYGHANMTAFTNPDFVALAESMGCKGYRVERTEDLLPTLQEAFRQSVPAVIDCPVDYGENVLLTKRLKELTEKWGEA